MNTTQQIAQALWQLRQPCDSYSPCTWVRVYTWRGPTSTLILTELETPDKIERRVDGHAKILFAGQERPVRVYQGDGQVHWDVAQAAFEQLKEPIASTQEPEAQPPAKTYRCRYCDVKTQHPRTDIIVGKQSCPSCLIGALDEVAQPPKGEPVPEPPYREPTQGEWEEAMDQASVAFEEAHEFPNFATENDRMDWIDGKTLQILRDKGLSVD